MKCRSCDKVCNAVITEDKKFCSACQCSYLDHVNYDSFVDTCLGMVNEICCNNKSTERNIDESTKLAKTFGTVWLPLGIQPSEVDRFLKYFPTNTDIRRSMFMKSDNRCLEVQSQLPLHDRSIDKLHFLTGDISKKRADNFFEKRFMENCDVARIDHLDRSEGNTCSDCHDSMGFGEVCVMLPKSRAISSSVWHPHCFKCIKCKHLLIDYLFCWDNKSDTGPYCLRHFDDKYNARCARCDELIFDEQYPSIFDQSYHADHLRCVSCNCQLSETSFVLESATTVSNKLWQCLSCLKETNDTFCGLCNEIIDINDDLAVTMDGSMVHERCVKCHICHNALSLANEASYNKENNYLFCLSCDSQRDSNTCCQCKESLDRDAINDSVTHGLYSWHKHCLVCLKCHKSVSDNAEEFILVSDPNKLSRSTTLIGDQKFVICKDCFVDKHADNCDICNERIDNAGVNHQGRLYHKTCFLCYQCQAELNPAMFTIKDGHGFCLPCYGQLFCKKCSCCTMSILGHESGEKMVSFENRNWHEACFICTNCQKSLMESAFLFDNEKIICIECGVK